MNLFNYITSLKNFSLVLLFSLCFNTQAHAENKIYDHPVKFNPRYVTSPEDVILKSLDSRGWQVKAKHPGKITGWLNNYKDYEIILDIFYNNTEISFEHVSAKKLNCKRSHCKVNPKHYDKWRLYLRKSIALTIHTLAINELLEKPSIKAGWLSTLKNGSVKEKIQFARNIIDIELFNQEALAVIEQEIIQGYKIAKMTGDQVQQYAFYCKVLARSKKPEYIELLETVRDNTPSKKLRKYVKGYLVTNFPSS
jgi:hypothetical protein